MIASRGYNMPFLKDGYKKPMPVIRHRSQDAGAAGLPNIVGFHGYPGPFTPAVQEVVANLPAPDMFTRSPAARPLTSRQWGRGVPADLRQVQAELRPHTPCTTGRGAAAPLQGASQFCEQQDRVSLARSPA